jgi:hypothetical protein
MLERTQDFNFLRESLVDAFERREDKDNSPEQREEISNEITNYLRRYHDLAKESYQTKQSA